MKSAAQQTTISQRVKDNVNQTAKGGHVFTITALWAALAALPHHLSFPVNFKKTMKTSPVTMMTQHCLLQRVLSENLMLLVHHWWWSTLNTCRLAVEERVASTYLYYSLQLCKFIVLPLSLGLIVFHWQGEPRWLEMRPSAVITKDKICPVLRQPAVTRDVRANTGKTLRENELRPTQVEGWGCHCQGLNPVHRVWPSSAGDHTKFSVFCAIHTYDQWWAEGRGYKEADRISISWLYQW